MSSRALTGLLPDLRKELRDAEARAQQALADVEHFRQIIAGIEGLSNGSAPGMEPQLILESDVLAVKRSYGTPRGREAVRRIMAEHPRRVWKQSEIFRELQKRGWVEPGASPAAARVATRRLVEAGGAEKKGVGLYRYKEPPPNTG
jgi:hypothetical protein